MQGDRGNMDSVILIYTTNAGTREDSLILINTYNAGRQGKYGLTHINLHY